MDVLQELPLHAVSNSLDCTFEASSACQTHDLSGGESFFPKTNPYALRPSTLSARGSSEKESKQLTGQGHGLTQEGEGYFIPETVNPPVKKNSIFQKTFLFPHILTALPAKFLCPLLCWLTLLATLLLLSKYWIGLFEQLSSDKVFLEHASAVIFSYLNQSQLQEITPAQLSLSDLPDLPVN